MPRRLFPRILLTALIVAAVACLCLASFRVIGLPFNLTVVDARSAVVSPLHGIDLPAGMQAGDRVDLQSLDLGARVATIQSSSFMAGTQFPGQRHDFAVRRGGTELTLTGVAADISGNLSSELILWLSVCNSALYAAIGLLLAWRGRDWAAAGMAVWSLANIVGVAVGNIPAVGMPALVVYSVSGVLFLSARVGFYVMAETVAGASLAPRARMAFRVAFALLLLLGALDRPGAGLIYAATGWAELLRREYGLLLVASYLPSVAILAAAYRSTDLAQRLRLRWMLWGSCMFLVGILLADTVAIGPSVSLSVAFCLDVIALFSILYAVLRHRVVKVSVVINRTLVYGAISLLVVGVLAAVNSLTQRAALGSNASLLLQLMVPLSLGIVLGKVRVYMDKLVERVFFRARYLDEKALKSFARRCGHIEDARRLLDTAVDEMSRHTHSPAVALYEISDKGYARVRQTGDSRYPEQLDKDDAAVVAVRADRKAVDLSDTKSGLGADGCVFPITVLGRLRGVLVLADRPGERFPADERKLITQVMRDVGAAWRILRARENEELIWALSQGTLDPNTALARARSLTAAWAGAPVAA